MLPVKRKISNDYFTEEGVVKKSGYQSHQFDKGIIKELIDNAIDFIETQDDSFIVNIIINEEGLFIGDDGPDFDLNMIDDVLMNYEDFISTNTSYHKVSRGSQGNALKSILGICYVKQYTFMICNEGKNYAYIPSDDKGNIRIIKTEVADNEYYGKGVYIKGFDSLYSIDINTLKTIIFKYSLSNKHITFLLNGQVVFKRSGEVKTNIEHSIHYYSSEAFLELAKGVLSYNQAITTKDFIKQFDNARSLMKDLPDVAKYLKDLSDNGILDLYYHLWHNTKPPTQRTLTNKYSLNADDLQATINDHYKRVFELVKSDSFFKYDISQGFVYVQCFLFYNPEIKFGWVNTLAIINRSIQIEWGDPFGFNISYYTNQVKNISNGKKGDYLIVYNLVSPNFTYTDYGKSEVDLNNYRSKIIDLHKSVFAKITKEVKSEINEKIKKKRANKTALMKKHFIEAYQKAKGNFAYVMARQIFYKLREILNAKYEGIDLNKSDNKKFTNEIITYFKDKDELYDNTIFMERRGFFYNPYYDIEIPLSTKEVRNHIAQRYENKISMVDASLSPQYIVDKALFIEKQGFIDVIKESGILETLNMEIICSQGMGIRAVKELISYYNDLGITVYCLHDCDVAGMRIYHNLANPTNTFQKSLSIIDIGINPSDVLEHGWIPEVSPLNSFQKILETMKEESPDDYKFFFAGYKEDKKQVKRVEINALSNDELIDFIKAKIKPTILLPGDDIIKNSMEFDEAAIKDEVISNEISTLKDKIYEKWLADNKHIIDDYKSKVNKAEITFDADQFVNKVKKHTDYNTRWIEAARSAFSAQKNEKINLLCNNARLEI
jgi:hypothetical protein